jgi:hypothetical protein
MKKNIFEMIELRVLDLLIQLLSQFDQLKVSLQSTNVTVSGRQMVFLSVVIFMSGFMGLLSSFAFYYYLLGLGVR